MMFCGGLWREALRIWGHSICTANASLSLSRAISFNLKANEKIAKIASAHRRKYNNIKAFFPT